MSFVRKPLLSSLFITSLALLLTACPASTPSKSSSKGGGIEKNAISSYETNAGYFSFDAVNGRRICTADYKTYKYCGAKPVRSFEIHKKKIKLAPITFKKFMMFPVDYTGSGIDKTIIEWPRPSSNKKESPLALGSHVFSNMTIKKPTFVFKGFEGHVIFSNVKFVGPVKIDWAFTPNQSEVTHKRIVFSFVNCEFEQPPEIINASGNNIALYVGASRLVTENGVKPYQTENFNGLALDSSKSFWEKSADNLDPMDIEYTEKFRIFSEKLSADVKKHAGLENKMVQNGYPYRKQLEYLNSLATTATASVQEIKDLAFGEKDDKKAQKIFAISQQLKASGNYLLEKYTLARTKQLAENLPAGFDLAEKANLMQLEKLYGCEFGYNNLDSTADIKTNYRGQKSAYKIDKGVGTRVLQETATEVTPLLTTYASENSICNISLNLNLDFFEGVETGNKVTTREPIYRETQASQARGWALAQAREAAREAAWDAAMSRTNAAVNRLTSVANQLNENRNSIESRAGGTYLVINNQKLRDEGVQDRQKYMDAQSRAQAAKYAASAGYKQEYEKSGEYKVTSTFYMRSKDAYQADLLMTDFNGDSAFYSAAPVSKVRSVGPCTRTQATDGFHQDIKGPCMRNGSAFIGYTMDYDMRKEYVQRRLEPIFLDFVTSRLLPRYIDEITKKSNSSNKADVLEAQFMSYMIGEKSEGLKIAELGKEVLGESISLERVSKYMFGK